MTQSGAEFAQTVTTTVPNGDKEKFPSSVTTPTAATTVHHCDIHLANFQIKKKRYRVLLNYDHIVWEPLDTKRASVDPQSAENNSKQAEFEAEQLSQRISYGRDSRVLHVNDLIRVSKGHSKSEALQLVPPQSATATQFGAPSATDESCSPANNSSPTEQYLALSYAERIIHSATDCNRWRVRKLLLYNSDAYLVRQWYTLLNKMLDSVAPQRLRVRRLLVFINPYGGRKQGLQVYERHCKPLFQLAGIDASCIISQRSNQIRDILCSHDLTPFDAICCVGGDGTVAEVINGLIFRAIHDAQLDMQQPEYVPKPSLPIAIIPAGSTDTVAFSLHGTADVGTAAIHLILGQRRGVDICSVRNRDGIVRFCASVLSYGYLGDVAAKSEKYRWMGTKRYEFAGVKAFLLNRGYDAEIRLEQSADLDAETVSSTSNSTDTVFSAEKTCCVNCVRCNAASATNTNVVPQIAQNSDEDVCRDEEGDNKATEMTNSNIKKELNSKSENDSELDNFDSVSKKSMTDCDRNSKGVSTMEELQNNKHSGSSLQESKDSKTNNNDNMRISVDAAATNNWKTVNGKFFMISGTNITCACSRSPNGISRYAHLGDGCVDLVLVRKTSLLNNVRLLLNTMGRNGDIRNLPFVEVHRTKKFCFRTPFSNTDEEYASIRGSCQPIADDIDNENVSRWNCDGEVITDLELIMSSHCQLIDVFMRGPHKYTKPSKSAKKTIFCCKCCSSND